MAKLYVLVVVGQVSNLCVFSLLPHCIFLSFFSLISFGLQLPCSIKVLTCKICPELCFLVNNGRNNSFFHLSRVYCVTAQ